MLEIEELDKESLVKSKKRKIAKYIKRTVLGILAGSIMISTVPNIKYGFALNGAKQDSSISEIMDSSAPKVEKIEKIFKEAINKNNNIDDGLKQKIIEAFTERVIKPHGELFSDKTIYNMYAVASTEKINFMSEFEQEHGWWSGDYNSYLNRITISSDEPDLLAHEQLHAILKRGLFNSGFTDGLRQYGSNEAFAASLLDDSSYRELQWQINILSYILGYENTFKHFVNFDFNGLKQELLKYIDESDVNTFIGNMNNMCFNGYYKDFMKSNGMDFDLEEYSEKNLNLIQENIDIMKKIYVKKYDGIPENTNRGRLLLKSLRLYTDLEGDYYIWMSANNSNTVKIELYSIYIPEIEFESSNKDFIKDWDIAKKEVSQKLGLDEDLFYLRSVSRSHEDDDKYIVRLDMVGCKIDKNKIDDFDIDSFIESNTKKEPEKSK